MRDLRGDWERSGASDPYDGERWSTHHAHCICYVCRRRRRLEREALVERRVLVDSTPVAQHIEPLLAAGWKRIDIAREASVSPALITKASMPATG